MQSIIAKSPLRALLAALALITPTVPALASAAGAVTGDTASGIDQDDGEANGPIAKPGPVGEKPFSFELGVLPHYLDNYYQSHDNFDPTLVNSSPKSVTIVTLSGAVDYSLMRQKDRKLNARVQIRHDLYTNLDHANSTNLDATLVYDARPSLLKLGYFGSRHRLVSDDPNNRVYGATNGLSAEYSYRFTKRLRGRIGYRFSRQTYSSATSRNLSEHNFSGEFRYQIVKPFMPAIGLEYSRGNTAASAYDYKRKAAYVSVTSEIGDNVYLNFRYRRSQRDYLTQVPSDSYFGRKDPRDDLSFYGTIQLGGGLSVFGYGTYTKNRSNQPSHRFDSNEAGLGLFYRL